MENLKDLIKECIDDRDDVLCISLSYNDDDNNDDETFIYLPINGDMNEFMDKLDIMIDPIWVHLDATVWFTNNRWATYDVTYDYCYGHWYYHRRPDIPEYLNKELV